MAATITVVELVVIVHNIRSTHNVGAILRTCDGFGVSKVYFGGYTPYPSQISDTRLPHIHQKLTKQIHKTALGAELTVPNSRYEDIVELIKRLKADGFQIVALEQAKNSVSLPDFKPKPKVALLLGEEVEGITKDLLKMCNAVIEIPMHGSKESFNVSVAAGIALYQLMLKG